MNISQTIFLKGFKIKKTNKKIITVFKELTGKENHLLNSLSKFYKVSYTKKILNKYKKYSNITLVGMGGSSLGAMSIYSFLKEKIKKNFFFMNNLNEENLSKIRGKDNLNLIISKSGNTLETITNLNLLKLNKKNTIFITEKKKSYLRDLANKLKSEIIFHNNFIGGRYSVLSEVGMLPAELMGLNPVKFRQFNNLIKNKIFLNSLISNVSCLLDLGNKKKNNSIILNYDEKSCNFFKWYQQLVAESLGKKGKGFLPIISNMPMDNHSLMQFYLSGPKNNFYTFFFVKERSQIDINKIKYAQFIATQRVFKKKKIPFRSFIINKRSEKTLGELFTFFILETILLGKVMNVNPYDQPAVELIKKETKKFLKNLNSHKYL